MMMILTMMMVLLWCCRDGDGGVEVVVFAVVNRGEGRVRPGVCV